MYVNIYSNIYLDIFLMLLSIYNLFLNNVVVIYPEYYRNQHHIGGNPHQNRILSIKMNDITV
jgi:hypothetical protein